MTEPRDGVGSAWKPSPAPVMYRGHWSWSGGSGAVRYLFRGKAAGVAERDLEAELEEAGIELATLRQTHSATVVEAAAGGNGEGDALVTARSGLALRVVTADCVPVILASSCAIAAVHAGWRGLAAGIVGAAARRLEGGGPVRAVIGPAIGGCCYEVGPEVATAVAAGAGSEAVVLDRGAQRRPHLDLRLAARLELERAGVEEIATIEVCTRCDQERLWSYRREGARAGRNLALVWRER